MGSTREARHAGIQQATVATRAIVATTATIVAGSVGFRPKSIELAALPLEIRGFGHIKARNVEKAKAREAELLARFREGGRAATAA